MFQPGGFPRPLAARERKWNTDTGKANFTVPDDLTNRIDVKPDVYQLITLRADGQFNTTVYTEEDRFRGIYNGRMAVLMNPEDIGRTGLRPNDTVKLVTDAADGVTRELGGLKVVPYNIPPKCIAAYYPEANVLVPLWHHAEHSKVPAAKSVPVRIFLEKHATE
jgi:anaerobic selenocysteine-containing dehydrogenase